MKKTNSILILTAVFVVIFAAACSTSSATQPAAEQPAQQQAAPVDAQPVVATQSFAPACQGTTSCAAPDVEDTIALNTYCVTKQPYQNISVPPGTTFESLDTKGELKCADSGTVVDGMNIISCTGAELWTYELKLTNTACAGGSNLQAGTTSCADGEGYDAASNCCSPMSAGDSSSVIIKVNIGACP